MSADPTSHFDLSELLLHPAPVLAPNLLGQVLASNIGDELVRVRLNEVEAYTEDDPASHSYCGRTERNRTMFGPPGHLYVYRSYGIHWCANFSTGPPGTGQGVLLRGGTILTGRPTAERRRGKSDQLTNGPAKLTQTMGIEGFHDGTNLMRQYPDPPKPDHQVQPIWLEPGTPPTSFQIGPRIGISQAKETPWRFWCD